MLLNGLNLDSLEIGDQIVGYADDPTDALISKCYVSNNRTLPWTVIKSSTHVSFAVLRTHDGSILSGSGGMILGAHGKGRWFQIKRDSDTVTTTQTKLPENWQTLHAVRGKPVRVAALKYDGDIGPILLPGDPVLIWTPTCVMIDGTILIKKYLYKSTQVDVVTPIIGVTYPHDCPRCGMPAYVGFNVEVDCSQRCDLHRNR